MQELALTDFTDEELRVSREVSAVQLTTFGLGGPFELLVELQRSSVVAEVLRRCAAAQVDWRILGAGSNLLVSDRGVSGLTLKLGRKYSGWSEIATPFEPAMLTALEQRQLGAPRATASEPIVPEPIVLVLAGTPLMSLSRQLSSAGFAGLEFAAGIPGTIGGAIAMNAGAHGSQLAAVIESVILADAQGNIVRRSAAEMHFTYRHSNLAADEIALAAVLRLRRREPAAILERRAAALQYRKQTQPLHLPSAGSVFKNPANGPAAAAMLDQLGFKGRTRGNVGFSTMHANWLVRLSDSGEADDALFLIETAQQEVESRFGLHLEPEIIRW